MCPPAVCPRGVQACKRGPPGASPECVNTHSPVAHVRRRLNLKVGIPEKSALLFPGEFHTDVRRVKLVRPRSSPPGKRLWRQQDGAAGGVECGVGVGVVVGVFRSVRPLRNAALHLQHFGPAVIFVGFLAVLYVLEERGTVALMFNQTRWAKVKSWLFQPTSKDVL